MGWRKVQIPGKKDWSEFTAEFKKKTGMKYTKRPRYFVDENLGAGTTEVLKNLKANVTDVWSQGLVGKGDEHIWRFCQSERRILLSHDDDFFDERLFPLRNSFGFVMLPHSDGIGRELVDKLCRLVSIVDIGQGFTFETKIAIRENNHWEFRGFEETGAIRKSLYDVSDPNHVFLLEEN